MGPVGDSGSIPATLTAAGAAINFPDRFDVLYDVSKGMLPASPTPADIATFAASVKNTANWKTQVKAAWPLTNGSLFSGS